MIERLAGIASRARYFLRCISDSIHSNWRSRFCLLGVLILVSIFGWSAVVNWALQMMESVGTEPAEAFASFVLGYEGGGVAATIYWSLVSLPFFAGLWYLRTHDTLAQARRTERANRQTDQANKSTLDSLNETLFHNASERLYHEQKQLRAEGLLTLKDIRDTDVERFGKRVDRVTSRGIDLKDVKLADVDMSDMFLMDITLEGAVLLSANLTGAILGGANLAGAALGAANCTKANFVGANLTKANLLHVNFTDATLNGADLTGAILDNADFKGANVSHVKIPFDSREQALRLLKNFDGAASEVDYVGRP